MGATSRAWIVVASVGAVEALKDQGFCRWNYAIRSFHRQAKNQLGAFSQAPNKLSSLTATVAKASAVTVREEEKARQSEESLRKVMYLSCWGPN